MSDKTYQMIGLIGFILAGFIYIAVGVNYGDMLTVVGSVVWIIACFFWMIPILRK